jgi:hypothetical protein
VNRLRKVDPIDVELRGEVLKKVHWRRGRMRRSVGLKVTIVGVVLLVGASIGLSTQARAEDITMEVGPGRHFFMFKSDNPLWITASARILQDGREIATLGGADGAGKYTKQWTWHGHAGEEVEVTLHFIRWAGRFWVKASHDEVYHVPVDRNTCFRRDGTNMVVVGDSTTGNCTPD